MTSQQIPLSPETVFTALKKDLKKTNAKVTEVDDKVDAIPEPVTPVGEIKGGCRFNAVGGSIGGDHYWGIVVSLEYISTGIYRVALDPAESDEFYQVQVTCGDANDDGDVYCASIPKKFQEANQFRVHVFGVSTRTYSDADSIMVQVARLS